MFYIIMAVIQSQYILLNDLNHSLLVVMIINVDTISYNSFNYNIHVDNQNNNH